MDMNTFTIDTWHGRMNEKTSRIEAETRKRLTEVAEQFVRACIDNDIEVSSADGMFYSLAFQQLTEARAKVVSELKKQNGCGRQ